MTFLKATLAMGLALVVSGCSSLDVASRNLPFFPQAAQETGQTETGQTAQLSNFLTVSDIQVTVPRDLRVSEAEVYYPVADIVWRGEPRADRYEQVAAIFEQSATLATQDLHGGQPARIEIEVLRFHSLSDKARYTVGGNHAMNFVMSVTDPVTGAVLMPPQTVRTDLKAFGGQQAIKAEERGETQKKRVLAHLSEVISETLAQQAAPVESVTRQAPLALAPLDTSEMSFSGLY